MKKLIFLLLAMQFSISNGSEMIVVAHRGLPTQYPENSAMSIKAAYAANAKMVETDFHLTKSGLMVCAHQEGDLRALSGSKKKICDLCAADLKEINLSSPNGKWKGKFGFVPIPTLAEILAVVPQDRVLQAEIKFYGADYADKFVREMKSAKLAPSNFLITSFNADWLSDFKKKCPEFDTMYLVKANENIEKILQKAKHAGVSKIALGGDIIDADIKKADAIRAAGFEVRAWGVNKKEQVEHAEKIGVKAFTTNHFVEFSKLQK